jgi:hypothetical protein
MNDILGGSQVLGLLSPELQAQAEQRARSAGLTNLGFALLQASQGQPGQRRPGLGQIIGQAGPVGLQAYQQSFDRTLQDMLRAQQIQDLQKQRAQREQQELARQRFAQQFAPVTPQTALQAPGQVGPTAARAAMIGQTPALDRNQLLSAILDPNMPADVAERAKTVFEATKPVETKAAPGIVGEFQAATASGLIPATTTLAEYIQMKKPPAPSATAIAGGRPDTFTEEVQKAEAKDFVTIKQSGQQAQRASRDITRLDTYLSRIDTGGAAAFKQAAGNIGINTEGLNDIQAAQAIINKLVPAQRPPGSGTMSDADLALYKESLPRIINQPGANREIVRSMKEINDYLIEEGKIAAEVTAGRITPEEGTRRIFALGNPVQDFFDRTQPTAPRGPVRPTPQDQSLILKYLQPGR